jgi:hypothetical protein
LLVQARDRCADRIDLLHVRRDAAFDVGIHVIELRAVGLKSAGEILRIAEQRLPRRGGGRIVGDIDQPL